MPARLHNALINHYDHVVVERGRAFGFIRGEWTVKELLLRLLLP
jgi:hypothetical protein